VLDARFDGSCAHVFLGAIELQSPSADLPGALSREFEKNNRELKVHVEKQLVFNNTALLQNVARARPGRAYLAEAGRLMPEKGQTPVGQRLPLLRFYG
jgi:hypothetical protein